MLSRRHHRAALFWLVVVSFWLLPVWPMALAVAREDRPLIVIDAGHGGDRLGTVSADGVAEKDLALTLARRLRRELSRYPVRVLMTRETDIHLELEDRIELANRVRADAFVSIHLNAMPGARLRLRTRGIETYFLARRASGTRAQRVANVENGAENEPIRAVDDLSFILADLLETAAHREASQLAHDVHARLVDGLGARDRGVHQAPFRVLRGARVPAILVEVGFLSHPQESRLMRTGAYQRKIAASMARGIVEFLAARDRLPRDSKRPNRARTVAPVPRS